jgi:hypothetical protein
MPYYVQVSTIGVPTSTSDDLAQLTMNFTTKGELLHHPMFTCGLCDKKFSSPQAFGGHMSSHSKQKKKNKNFHLWQFFWLNQ